MRLDGHFEGHLIGMSMSGGATVWAACAERFVYPHARLGIHPCMWIMEKVKFNAAVMHSKYEEFTAIDRAACEIYTAASNKHFNWWWEFYQSPGDVKWLDAKTLVEYQMADLIL